LLLMGKLYHKQRRLPDAEQVLQYAMSVYQSQFGNHAEGIGRAASCLADCYLDRNQFAEAEKLLRRAAEIADARNTADDTNAAVTFYKIGIASAGQKNDKDAEAAFKKAADVFTKRESTFDKKAAHDACACYHQFAKFYLARGQRAQARPLLDKATKLAEAYPGYLDEADLADQASSAAAAN
jgi:tetratricopeptide (TPR) repeat protein